MAPEIGNGPYDPFKADIWALGIILYSMFVGTLPWNESNPSKLLSKIASGEYNIPTNASPLLADLITLLLEKVPSKRPSALDVLRHPWFQMIGASSKTVREILEKSKTYYNGRSINSSQTRIIFKPQRTSLKDTYFIKSNRSATNIFRISKIQRRSLQSKDPQIGTNI